MTLQGTGVLSSGLKVTGQDLWFGDIRFYYEVTVHKMSTLYFQGHQAASSPDVPTIDHLPKKINSVDMYVKS